MTLKRISLAAMAALIVVAVSIAALWNSAAVGTVQFEIVKSLLQLGVVVVLGGGASVALKVFEHDRKRADEAATRRADYLARVGSAYRSAKTARRYLRAAGLSHRYSKPPKHLSKHQAEQYEEEMHRLNRAQLELEALKIEALSLGGKQTSSQLAPELKRMEGYLRRILREYERHQPALKAGWQTRVAELERLLEFTESADAPGKPDDSRLLRDFSLPHGRVVQLINKGLT